MAVKKKLEILVVSALCICLFFAFGFQIDVIGVVNETGGTTDVSLIDSSRVAAEEANAAIEAAKLALEEAQTALAAVQAIAADIEAALTEAEQAVIDAQAALETAMLVAEEANAAYSGFKVIDEEELIELQLAAEQAQAALDAAIAAGASEEEIVELQEELDKAIAELEQNESGNGGNVFFHVITNSNNGGSFNMEGNYSSQDGDIVPYTFNAEEGFELTWLRVGNVKVQVSDLESLFEFSFDKKNLTIHAHFKKDKDYSPETTTEETTEQQDDTIQGDDSTQDNDNGKDNSKGKEKDKEKSNNGKKNKKK